MGARALYIVNSLVLHANAGVVIWFGCLRVANQFVIPLLEAAGGQSCDWLMLIGDGAA